MQLSIDKQKAAVRLQVGEKGASSSFFTTAWVSPRVIELPPPCDAMAESELTPMVKEAARRRKDVDAGLIRAVIRRESASVSCAISDKGAVGLMQLMPDVAQQFDVDPYDAKQNIKAGATYLKQLLKRYKGDTSLALAAYNAGAARVDAVGGVPDIPETRAYVEAILKELDSPNGAISAASKLY